MSVPILSPSAVDANREALEQFAEDWGPSFLEGSRIDWEDLIDRLERNLDWDLPTDWSDPTFRRLKKIVRDTLREMGEID